jgi:hypothetical protein
VPDSGEDADVHDDDTRRRRDDADDAYNEGDYNKYIDDANTMRRQLVAKT